jgi:hypothetical protein
VKARIGVTITKEQKAEIARRTETLIGMTNAFCDLHLDEEYKQLCEKLIRKMARKRVVPFMSGRPESWAAGVVHAIGIVNFLFDKSFEPSSSIGEIAAFFVLGQSTVQQKSKTIRDMFRMFSYDTEFSTRRMIEGNPMANFVLIDGIPVDARTLPDEIQEVLRRAKLIP